MYFNFNFTPYIAIIGDMKESKRIDNRREVQDKLKNALDGINLIYNNDIASNFTITLGDEFQGLLNNGANVINIIQKIEIMMFPTKLRFGIGVGEITTDINPDISIGADGSAYYKARDAVNYLKDAEKRRKTAISDIRIEIDGEYKIVTELLNTILSLTTTIKNSWTTREREIIWDVLEYKDNQIKMAERLNISQPAVQKLLTRGRYYTYQEAFDTITNTLSEVRR